MERTDTEIEEKIDQTVAQISQAQDEGKRSKWAGMTYEEGVETALRWVLDDDGDDPLEE